MNNKVKFLRGTSNEYAVAEKDSDTIYFTTDDGKLYIGDKEVSGSDVTIDDTLSDTSTNPVQNKVVKHAIDNKADKTVATTSADGLMSAEDKGKLDAFEITTTGGKLHDKDIATTDLIPTSLPANGGNADTVDGLHASDFVNATDRNHIQIPSNVDVPAWIYANGKRYQLYMTNDGNIGLTNVPNDSIGWVWYWFDGINIFAREWTTGKYYICDTINGGFSGWKDVYTLGNKPYVTGVVVVDSNGKANVPFGFDPSFVLYMPTSPKSGIFGSVYSATTFNATGFTPSADTYTGGLTGNGFSYIAFK